MKHLATCLGLLACLGCPSGPPPCGPSNCGGCCSGNVCQTATTDSQCGSGGATCGACLPGSHCTNGACTASSGACSTSQPCATGQTCLNGTCCPNGSLCGTSCVPTTGLCQTNTTVQYCAVATGMPPTVQSYTCANGEVCMVSGGSASCVPTGACVNGSTQCQSTSVLESCNNGSWATTNCPNGCLSTASGAQCKSAVATQSITATVQYQARTPLANYSGWSATTTNYPARGFLVLSFQNGTTTLLDAQLTNANGTFTVQIPQTPGSTDGVYVVPAILDSSGNALLAVANPGFASPGTENIGTLGTTPTLWSWSIADTSLTGGGTFTIAEANGSGAARIFDTLNPIYRNVASRFTTPQLTLVAWLGYGTSWSCGSCYAHYPGTLSTLQFQAQIWYAGATTDQAYYADAVTAHEFGHSVMQSYGTQPGEGGQHVIGCPDYPGMAWSEGWATWFSSDERSDPIYFDVQTGSAFWWSIATDTYGGAAAGTPWTLPTVAGGLLQHLDENEVSSMLWSLSNSATGADASLFTALHSARLNGTTFSRGYTRHQWSFSLPCDYTNVTDTGISVPAFPDFLDALDCGGFSKSAIDTATNPSSAYPYASGSPVCQ